MTQVLRSLLFWLMMLALPVQGLAQAGMLACHAGGGETQSMHESVDGMDHHEHADQGEQHQHGDHSPGAGFQTGEAPSDCCACGPSCGVLAIEMIATTPALVQHDVFNESTTDNPFPATAGRRIDRPPKFIPA